MLSISIIKFQPHPRNEVKISLFFLFKKKKDVCFSNIPQGKSIPDEFCLFVKFYFTSSQVLRLHCLWLKQQGQRRSVIFKGTLLPPVRSPKCADGGPNGLCS